MNPEDLNHITRGRTMTGLCGYGDGKLDKAPDKPATCNVCVQKLLERLSAPRWVHPA